MNNSKLYVGRLVQVIPCKGYGFISPKWNSQEDSDNNIYCYYASNREKARRKCFIKMLDKSKTSLHEEVKNFKGEVLWIATEPQTVYFRVAFQATETGHKLMAYDLFDERHLSEEEKAEAEANSAVKPNFSTAITVHSNDEELDAEAPVEEEATVVAPVEPAAEEEAPIEEEKEKTPIEEETSEEVEPSEEDGYDSEEDEEYSEEDNSSYYGELAGQYGYDDEVVNCYKPIRARRYDDEVVRDKKSQKKASKAKRAQKTFKPEEDKK